LILPSASSYTRIRLELEYEKEKRFYVEVGLSGLQVALQKLQNKLEKKNLQVAFPERMIERCKRDADSGKPWLAHSSKPWLGLFELLRCVTIEFVDFPQDEWRQIANAVQSKKEVVDLPAEADKLLAYLDRCMRSAGGRDLMSGSDYRERNELIEAARSFEVRKFIEVRNAILKRADEWIGSAKRRFLIFDAGAVAHFLTSEEQS